MRRSDREARRTRAKELGRVAYRLARAEDVSGVIAVEDEEKHVREFQEGGLTAELLIPFRANARPEEFSRLQVRHCGRKVLELRWSKAGDFSLVHFEPGDWEGVLESEPPPMPF